MKRFLTILVAVMLYAGATTTSEAQYTNTRYQGEVYVSGGYGIGNIPLNRLQLHTVHGARVGECFSAGIGLGADWYTQDFNSGLLMVPIFADFKVYAPTASRFDPFIMLDLGYSFQPESPSLGGMMFGAGLGFHAGCFALSAGYHLQQLSIAGINLNMGAIQLKLGVAF